MSRTCIEHFRLINGVLSQTNLSKVRSKPLKVRVSLMVTTLPNKSELVIVSAFNALVYSSFKYRIIGKHLSFWMSESML